METLVISNNFATLPVSENIQIVNVEQSLLLNLPSDLNVLIDRTGISTKTVLRLQNKFKTSQLLVLNSQEDWMISLQEYNMIETCVTENDLISHIRQLSTGRFVFSEEELNNRAELVECFGYSVIEAVNMDMSSVYAILEGGEEEQEDYSNEYGFTCNCCGKPVKMEYTDRNGDGYNLVCEDENCDYGFVSANAFDCE